MRGKHVEDFAAVTPGFLDVRTVSRWFPPQGQCIESKDGLPQAVDLTDATLEFARTFQQTTNDDTVTTSFTICPDMLWPLALGVGFQSHFPSPSQLLEVDDPKALWKPINGACTTFSDKLVVPEVPKGRRGELVVVLGLGGEISPWPEGWSPANWSSLRVRSDEPGESSTLQLIKGRRDGTYVDPNLSTATCAKLLWDLLRENPEATVVVLARLPKTVSFALGWRLGEKLDCLGQRPFDPWRRLVTVQVDFQPPVNVPTVMRVNPAQPSLQEMVDITARAVGLSQPSVNKLEEQVPTRRCWFTRRLR